MTQMTINIGLTGMARAGKDTVARILLDHYGYQRLSVADPLKAGINAALGCFGATPADETKDTLIPELGTTPRQIWKDFSEEFLKKYFGRDIMARIMAKQASLMTNAPIVVTDVRFNEEAELLVEQGFKIIKVVRPGQTRREQDHHVSENGIDERFVFATIYNHDQPDALLRDLDLDNALRKMFNLDPSFQEVLEGEVKEEVTSRTTNWGITDYQGTTILYPCK